MEKIIVTGGTGYIGSHTSVELINQGYQVVIADNLSNSSIEVLDSIQKITGTRPQFKKLDLCEQEEVLTFFRQNSDARAVIHFAALKAVGESVEKPLQYYHNNITSLVYTLMAMEKFNIPALVFSSSCTVYGQPDQLPVSEKAPIKRALSPYGNTKQIAERIIEDTIKAIPQLKAISLRYFNPIGAHPSGFIGELPRGAPLNLVPLITQTAAGVREKLKIFGDSYNTPDGSAIRDYINVIDVAKAHIVALERMLSGKQKERNEIFNLGTGTGISVFELVRSFESTTRKKVPIEIAGKRSGDIAQVWADPALANCELGWKAEVSLEETLTSAWNWEKSLINMH